MIKFVYAAAFVLWTILCGIALIDNFSESPANRLAWGELFRNLSIYGIVLAGIALLIDYVKHLLLSLVLVTTCNAQVYGVDLSHHNTVADWNKVEASFCYLKATEGATYRDAKFANFYVNAKKRNIPVGAYHFFTTSVTAEKQFENFKKVVPKDCDLLPVLDVEKQTKGHYIDQDSLCAEVNKWIDLCESYYGKRPIIYTSQIFYLKNLTSVRDCQMWYGDVNHKVWLKHAIHQTTICPVPGIVGKVDYNVLSVPIDSISL